MRLQRYDNELVAGFSACVASRAFCRRSRASCRAVELAVTFTVFGFECCNMALFARLALFVTETFPRRPALFVA